MKAKKPDGRIIDMNHVRTSSWCRGIKCDNCPVGLEAGLLNSNCSNYVEAFPRKAATLMGYEVIEEGEEKVQPMTGTEFQEKAMRTAATSDSDKLLLNGVMGLNGESGECIDVLKKYLFQGHELDEEKLMDELSDVMWYAAITATGLGVTLDEVMEHNVEKLKNRYPDGFDKDRSIHREG